MGAWIPAPFNQIVKKDFFLRLLYLGYIWMLSLGKKRALWVFLNLCLGIPDTQGGSSVQVAGCHLCSPCAVSPELLGGISPIPHGLKENYARI